MKIAFRLALLALAAGLGFWLWTILFPSPEKVVLKKVADLAATATIKAGDGTRTLSGRDELRETAAGAFTQLSSVNVQFFDATAKVTADKQSAVVTCTARVSVGDGKDFGIQELRVQFKKIDGDWRITRAETVKTLK